MTNKQFPEAITTKKKDEFSTKRKLIKGSLAAVPVVMTLKSGAAMALTSTEQCIARSKTFANTNNPEKFADTGTGAPFFRTPVQKLVLVSVVEDIPSGRWILTGGVEVITNIYQHDTPVDPNNWAGTDDPQIAYSADLVNPTVDVYESAVGALVQSSAELYTDGSGGYFYKKTQESKDGLVVFDDDGLVLSDILGGPRVGGFTDTPLLNGLNHLTGSCWASLNP